MIISRGTGGRHQDGPDRRVFSLPLPTGEGPPTGLSPPAITLTRFLFVPSRTWQSSRRRVDDSQSKTTPNQSIARIQRTGSGGPSGPPGPGPVAHCLIVPSNQHRPRRPPPQLLTPTSSRTVPHPAAPQPDRGDGSFVQVRAVRERSGNSNSQLNPKPDSRFA